MKYSPLQIAMGIKAEREHDDVTHGNMKTILKIVKAHLKEVPDYYTRLKKMESEGKKEKTKTASKLFNKLKKY